MGGLYSRLRDLYTGDRPVIVDAPYVDTSRDPRRLSDGDLESFFAASSQRRAGMATWSDFKFVLDKLKKSDAVRVMRIYHDIRWLAKKARRMGIEWDDHDL